MPASQTYLIESRIQALESIIGNKPPNNPLNENIESRLDHLKHLYESTDLKLLHKEIQKNEKLQEKVVPESALLTHQNYDKKQSKLAAPLVYRKYEILAEEEFLRKEQDKLACIDNLLHQRFNDRDNNDIPLHKSPIIESDNYLYASNPENKKQLDDVMKRVLNVSRRLNKIVNRLDDLTDEYNATMVAAIEKMVLSNEILLSKSEKR